MMQKSRTFVAVTSVLLLWFCNASVRNLSVMEKCAKSKADATAELLRCLVREKIWGVQGTCDRKHSRKLEKAQDRASRKGEECSTVDDAAEIQKTMATFVDVILGNTSSEPAQNVTSGKV